MTDRSVQIRIPPPEGVNGRGQLIVGGADISSATRAMSIDFDVDNLPLLTVDLITYPVDIDTDHASIEIPKRTRDALVALGWTPPADPTPTGDPA